ncbi:flavin oxidoreductase [Mesorhizobium sp. L-8-10]|uniref:flavin reductase family protein n=1 Tax=Mesorhizobium sp. L-8-10 TaxID=2744523 RepID=UPI0019287894|nr:flavin reductase family protein [Mesorhizobium sp. L-8-10]BCH29902.1 flavin oxidoreductase [Mesorhizobium sp. L-8-10]
MDSEQNGTSTEHLIAPKEFWGALGRRPIGVSIATTMGPNGPEGLLALSATHFSGSPPVMSVAISRSTSALSTILHSGSFAINFLSADADLIYERFSSAEAPKGSARFSELSWHTMRTGAPVFTSVTGAMDCELDGYFEKDGTVLVFGRVVAIASNPDVSALIYPRNMKR